LNTVNDEAEVTCSGSAFQMRAPATGKAQEPIEVSRTAGTIRSSEVEDRSQSPQWGLTDWQELYIGTRGLHGHVDPADSVRILRG